MNPVRSVWFKKSITTRYDVQRRANWMKVILKQDVEKLGKKGDIKEVSAGFVRNFLLPKKLVLEATKSNIELIEKEKKTLAKKLEKEKEEYTQLAEKIKKLSLTISKQVGEEDKMFGAVTNDDIAEALKTEGIEIDKRKIELAEPIKFLGIYDVPIRLYSEVTALVKVWVVKA